MATNPYAYGGLKPLHRRAMLEILQSDEYPTPEAMANMLAKKLDELRAEDTQYITVREHPASDGGSAYFGTGPYPTFEKALKAIEKMRAGLPHVGKVAVVPTYSPTRMEASATRADTFPDYHKGHWALIRERAGVNE